jgi:hypothetical protein
MKKTIVFVSFLLLSQLSISCKKTLSDQEIKEYVWKCGEPCGLGDVLLFDGRTILRNDTIFLEKIPYGKIVKRTNDFDEDTKISIINLENPVIKDTCVFHAK